MPSSQVFMAARADAGSRGAYMALRVMSYAGAHIFAPVIGTYPQENFGFGVLCRRLAFACLPATDNSLH
ncbi:hypothetical protein [Rhodoflexus sp.]